jgi:hypothetical protein
MKNLKWLWFVTMAVEFYTTFVLQNLWNWFVVQAFNIPSISYWGAYGLVILVRLISPFEDFAAEQHWKTAFTVLDACTRG